MRLYFSVKGLLTGCWLTWPLGHSSVGSCRPACVGGTRLPPSCPEPWPSSTCYRPRSWRCHCGHRSQPGCPSNTQTKGKKSSININSSGKIKFRRTGRARQKYRLVSKSPQNWTSQSSRLSQLIMAEPSITKDFVMRTSLRGVHSGLRTTFPEGRAV